MPDALGFAPEPPGFAELAPALGRRTRRGEEGLRDFTPPIVRLKSLARHDYAPNVSEVRRSVAHTRTTLPHTPARTRAHAHTPMRARART